MRPAVVGVHLVKRLNTLSIFMLLFCLAAFSAHAQDARVYKDIPYAAAGTDKQTLDIYAPSEKGSYPVHIFVHGGAWMIGDKRAGKRHGEYYADQDVVFVSINYRLAPSDPHPAQMEDLASAVRWALQNIAEYGGDTERLSLSGHSAGAHLVALLASDPQYLSAHGGSLNDIDAVFAVDSASYDLQKQYFSKASERILKRGIRKTFGINRNVLEAVSPTYQVVKNKARNDGALPVFKIFVAAKREAAVADSKMFFERIGEAGGDAELFVVPDASHRDMNLNMSNPDSIVGQVMLRTIKGQSQ